MLWGGGNTGYFRRQSKICNMQTIWLGCGSESRRLRTILPRKRREVSDVTLMSCHYHQGLRLFQGSCRQCPSGMHVEQAGSKHQTDRYVLECERSFLWQTLVPVAGRSRQTHACTLGNTLCICIERPQSLTPSYHQCHNQNVRRQRKAEMQQSFALSMEIKQVATVLLSHHPDREQGWQT